MKLKEVLKDELSKDQLKILKRSFDIIGDIAVIEIPKELEKKKKKIAAALVMVHPHLQAVVSKSGGRKGKHRLRKFKVIFGRQTETIHHEHGCSIMLDVKKVYFSPRESTERQRIAGKVKPGERILVMFAGIGPYALAIAKKQSEVKKIYAVESNLEAVKFMETNVRINKLSDRIVPVHGDVRRVKLKDEFDRIVMPLPKSGYRYLDLAMDRLKPQGIIHFYHYDAEEKLFKKSEELLERAAKKAKRKIKILERKKVLPYAPRVWKICIDARVS